MAVFQWQAENKLEDQTLLKNTRLGMLFEVLIALHH